MALKQAAGVGIYYVETCARPGVTKGWIVARGPKVATGKMVYLTSTSLSAVMDIVIFEEPSSVLDNLHVCREQILIHNQKGDSIPQLCLHRTEIS